MQDPAACSYSGNQRPTHPQNLRRSRGSRQGALGIAPSSGLLALLATVAASSSTVEGIPLPFLCPSLDSSSPVARHIPRDDPLDVFIQPSPSPIKRRLRKRYVPVKFERADDGHWRRVETYSLYGSTMCLTCVADSEDSSLSSSDDPDDPPGSTSAITATPSDIDILDTLPSGWKPLNHATTRTSLILSLSLVLAFAICFLIIGCLFWRKSIRRKHQENDIEMKARRRRARNASPEEDEEAMLEKEIKQKKKLWAKATARWKANARYTARQRRGKRVVSSGARPADEAAASSVSIRQTTETLDAISSAASSSAPSRSASRRSSISSVHASGSPDPALAFSEAEDFDGPSSSPLHPASASPASVHPPLLLLDSIASPLPPAYHPPSSRAAVARTLDPPIDAPKFDAPLNPPPHPSASRSSDVPLEYTPSPHAAHVATDDKALLEQMTQLASAPPLLPESSPELSPSGNSLQVSSAPIWQDEQLDDFALAEVSSDLQSPSCPMSTDIPIQSASPFPPPPSKGKMPAYYDYPFSFEEDMSALEPELGPSAPPFEETGSMGASVPMLEDIGGRLTPSAPPLFEETEDSSGFDAAREGVPGESGDDSEELTLEYEETGSSTESDESQSQNHDREGTGALSPSHSPTSHPISPSSASATDTDTEFPIQPPNS